MFIQDTMLCSKGIALSYTPDSQLTTNWLLKDIYSLMDSERTYDLE